MLALVRRGTDSARAYTITPMMCVYTSGYYAASLHLGGKTLRQASRCSRPDDGCDTGSSHRVIRHQLFGERIYVYNRIQLLRGPLRVKTIHRKHKSHLCKMIFKYWFFHIFINCRSAEIAPSDGALKQG